MNCCRTALAICLLLTAAARLQAGETRDLILVAGQSNAVGYDAIASDLPADPADEKVLFWWRCGNPPPDEYDSTVARRWTHLQPQPKGMPLSRTSDQPGEQRFGLNRQYGNFSHTSGGFGPEIGLARKLLGQQDRPLAIVKAAFSGTGIRSDWNHEDKGDSGACYRALVSEVRLARAEAKQKGIDLQLRAIVWVRGESDSNAKDAPHYAAALTAMLAALRKDLEAPKLLALVSLNTRFGNGQNPHVAEVVKAQQSAAEKDPRCVYIDTGECETLPPRHTHFTTKGTLEMGRLFATELLKLEAAAATNTSPE